MPKFSSFIQLNALSFILEIKCLNVLCCIQLGGHTNNLTKSVKLDFTLHKCSFDIRHDKSFHASILKEVKRKFFSYLNKKAAKIINKIMHSNTRCLRLIGLPSSKVLPI